MYAKWRIIIIIIISIFSLPLWSNAQTPYVNVPGLSEDLDVEQLIEDLLEVERMPITQNENEISNYQIKIRILEDFETYADDLSTLSKSLYNYQSPFRDMIGESDDTEVLEATAERTAEEADYEIEVIQLAKSDSFVSDSYSKSATMEAVNFQITVGEETYDVSFPGGTIYKLQNAIEDATDDALNVRTLTDTKTTVVLAIEGEETGEDYSIGFDGNLSPLYEIGLLMESSEERETYLLDFRDLVSLGDDKILAEESKFLLQSGNEAELDVSSESIEIKSETTLNFSVNILSAEEKNPIETSIEEETSQDSTEDKGTLKNSITYTDIQLKKMDGVKISNINIEGGSFLPYYKTDNEETEQSNEQATNMVADSEEEDETETITQITNFTQIITIEFESGAMKRISITSNGDYSISLSVYEAQIVENVIFENNNTDKKYLITDMEFDTLINESGAKPQNPLSAAQNSIFKIDGIQIVRSDNNIDDVIDGVTLFIKDTSEDEVTLSIAHDYETIQDAIAEWVNSFNQVMEYLYYITKPTIEEDELYEKTDEEEQREGIFQTEYTLKNLKYKLRTAAMDAYETDLGRDLSLLQQVGIYTKEAGTFSSDSEEWLTTQMGLLNLDLDSLSEALVEDFDAVEQLFGYDSDGDYIRDMGAAYQINETLQLALGTGGFIDNKLDYFDDQIEDLEEENEELEDELEDYEQTQREKFGAMQETMKETDTMSKWFSGQMGTMSSGSSGF